MIILKPGYNGSILDPNYVRINGADYKISQLKVINDEVSQEIGMSLNGVALYPPSSYSLFTTDEVLLTPVNSYEELLKELNALNVYRYSGVNLLKVRNTAGNSAQVLLSGATRLHTIFGVNVSGANAFFKLFDRNTVPDPRTDVPLITLDAGQFRGLPISFQPALNFRNGLALCIVAGADDLDNTALAAGDVIVTLLYE